MRNGLLGFTKQTLTKFQRTVADDAIIAGIIAKNTGQNTIATTESSIRPGKMNRIWTGAMYEDFDADVVQTGNRIRIRYGWIKSKKKYYLTQEHGGFFLGKTITPMHAMANAQVAMEDFLKSKGMK
jgi:hypothetical protein